MKKFASLILTIFILVLSCDEENTTHIKSLDGEWVLQKAICFCHFGDDFEFSEHKIIINQRNNSLYIQNSDETNFIDAAGNYSLEINGAELSINKNLKYTFVLSEGSLTLSYVDNPTIADDEIVLEYSRAE